MEVNHYHYSRLHLTVVSTNVDEYTHKIFAERDGRAFVFEYSSYEPMSDRICQIALLQYLQQVIDAHRLDSNDFYHLYYRVSYRAAKNASLFLPAVIGWSQIKELRTYLVDLLSDLDPDYSFTREQYKEAIREALKERREAIS